MKTGRKGVDLSLAGLLNKPLLFIAAGALLLVSSAWLLFGGSSSARDSTKAMEQGRAMVETLNAQVKELRDALRTDGVQARALQMLEGAADAESIRALLSGRIRGVQEVQVLPPSLITIEPESLGDSGLVRLDMLLHTDPTGAAKVQILRVDGQPYVAAGAAIGDPESPDGYLLVLVSASWILDAFNSSLPAGGYLGLEQVVSGFAPVRLKEVGSVPAGFSLAHLGVAGSQFRVALPQASEVRMLSGFQRLMLFILGALLLAYGLIRRQVQLRTQVEFRPDPGALAAPSNADDPAEWSGAASSGTAGEHGARAARQVPELHGDDPPEAGDDGSEPSGEERVPLSDIHHQLIERRKHMAMEADPVELSREIFRAYDIRGVVGKTLDAGIAFQVGQAVGSLALERDASPVVVGRDGRHSGPGLVKGLVEGLKSTGCDVIDVGAVPTGALYWSAYELGAGSGVMVTGSHNPPDYNGLKILIGGHTLSGTMISDLYEAIQEGKLRSGAGSVRSEEILPRYQERIAGDIQLQRPLKVVADCGNGIGGSCAIDILRAIGAEVLPLYDDVDGDFPNHHPDPSDPHNLEDLINAVSIMDADLGVAFDGDADRLGVVTSSGEIVYADRLMMLYAREILSRNPGARIIYDVKCTGHLDSVITEAGGVPEMYKTGHSLIKNHMKEAGSPFAGEMSGHFFFKDRWYGFDCGIYAAARLLEILAMDSRAPLEVLNSLPDSVSTPELKVELEEGENHAFIERFQAEARFENARVNTIDGLRADFSNGWGLVRASNTTPILVLRFDADTEEALAEVQEKFREQLLAIRPDLPLPF